MKINLARTLQVLFAAMVAILAPFQAYAISCSNASIAGSWAYTYTGTIFTPNGTLPLASVGHFTQDHDGSITGSQNRSVAGQSGAEDIAGPISVNKDCTASATIDVFVNGVKQRTAVIAVIYDNNGKQFRGIFQSLTLPDGTNVPVVITMDGDRI